ncbi:hypothetical protein JCM9534A_11220 [Catenuloplanes indicus JCM 9534]
MNAVADFDFGVTALAQQFHQDWPSEGAPMDVAIAYLDGQSAAHLAALADDLSFMIEWNARGDYVGSLWFASTMGNYQPRLAGMSSEGLLGLVLGECKERLKRESRPLLPGLRYRACGGEVLRVIRQLHDRLSDCLARSGLGGALGQGSPAAVEALHQYADSGAWPELAFRFLLRLLVVSNCTIGLAEYEDLREIGTAMGYGPFLVSTVEFLVE